MARKPRLHYVGALYHVMVRGNGGQDIFADDEDSRGFSRRRSFGISILNYTVTSKHIHLLVRDGRDTQVMPRAMQLIAGRTGEE